MIDDPLAPLAADEAQRFAEFFQQTEVLAKAKTSKRKRKAALLEVEPAAEWVTYETEDGRHGAVRADRIQGVRSEADDGRHLHTNIVDDSRTPLRVGNPAAAQGVYLFAARVSLLEETEGVADDVRQTIGVTGPQGGIECAYRPQYITTKVGPYYWLEGITEALTNGDFLALTGDPYQNLRYAALLALVNLMRGEDEINRFYLRREVFEDYAVRRSDRVHMMHDMDKLLEKSLKQHNPELYRLLQSFKRAADEETGAVDLTALADRCRVAEKRLSNVLRNAERRFGDQLDRLWEELGGYVLSRREIVHDWPEGFHFEPKRKKLF
jgi:hypothetical protein